MKRKKLVIISHTEHYKDKNGIVKGWGATINEVNYLSDFWEEVVHIGCLHKSEPPKSALPYTKKNIRFVAIPPYGGKTILSKILIITKIPKIIKTISKETKNATEVQLRVPTGMAVFLLPFFLYSCLENLHFGLNMQEIGIKKIRHWVMQYNVGG